MDADLAQIVKEETRATKEHARLAFEQWVAAEDGLGVLFSRKAYTLYGLAKRERDQNPYVRTGDLKRHVMHPGRVRAAGSDAAFSLRWSADARLLNFMKGKKQVYRLQFENVSKAEADSLDQVIQDRLNRAPASAEGA